MAQKKPPKKTTKNQHFVPKVYLKRWRLMAQKIKCSDMRNAIYQMGNSEM